MTAAIENKSMQQNIGLLRSLLSDDEKERYSRQLVVPGIGLPGQVRLKKSSVLIVGAGGLGCPVALYLAGAGVGTIGIVDGDTVDRSNLHRQIGHRDGLTGRSKVESLSKTIQELNPTVTIKCFDVRLGIENALEILKDFDVVVDATDNIVTRYILSDSCVMLGRKPLVSGAALRLDGQLITLCFDENSPCYRCIHPSAPSRDSVLGCAVGGILGPITGIIGSLQALEVISILAMEKSNYSGKMFVFSGSSGGTHLVTLRSRRTDCPICSLNNIPSSSPSPSSSVAPDTMSLSSMGYEGLWGTEVSCIIDRRLRILDASERIDSQEFHRLIQNPEKPLVVIDVRDWHDYDPFHPLTTSENVKIIEVPLVDLDADQIEISSEDTVVCVCRRGNDSQHAVRLLKSRGFTNVWDLKDGLHDYARTCNPNSIPIRTFL